MRVATRTAARIARSGERAIYVPGTFGVVIDTREQHPYAFPTSVPVEARALTSGDYSVIGYEATVAIERKSESDFIESITANSLRFYAELARLREYQFAAVVVESTTDRIAAKAYAGHSYAAQRVDPGSVLNHAARISVFGVPVFWCGTSRRIAASYTLRLLNFWWARQKVAERAERFAPKAP